MSKDYQALLTGLRPRPTFDVPKDPGVCLPYLFVKDDGKEGRHISMMYRLKAHPDITVMLEDSNAIKLRPGDNLNHDKFTAKGKATDFWNLNYRDFETIKSLWFMQQGSRSTQFAGQDGVKMFTERTHENGIKDLGYLVSVRGDPDAKEDKPDLMFFVIQTSENATKRGITPVNKDDFLKLAETIAASVKHREVTAQ